ncbi:MAG: hypothetical protein QNL21_04430, partial [Flavobacteriales bacterium]
EMSLILMNDSITSIIEANFNNSECNWSSNGPFWFEDRRWEPLKGMYKKDCPEGVDGTPVATIQISTSYDTILAQDVAYICLSYECEYGGTTLDLAYNACLNQFRIQFINDNEMAGDGLPGEFKFTWVEGDLVDEFSTFHKCRDY